MSDSSSLSSSFPLPASPSSSVSSPPPATPTKVVNKPIYTLPTSPQKIVYQKGLDQLLDVKLDFSEWEEELAMMETTEDDHDHVKVPNMEVIRITREFIENRGAREAAKALVVVKAEQELAARKVDEVVVAAPVVAALARPVTATRPRTTIPAATRPKSASPVIPTAKPKVNMATRVPLGPTPRASTVVRPSTSTLPAVRPRTTTPTSGTRVVTPVEPVVVAAVKPKVNMSTRVPLGPAPRARTTTPTSTAPVRPVVAAVRPRTTTPTSTAAVRPVVAAVRPRTTTPSTSRPVQTVEPAPFAPKKESVNMNNRKSLAPTRGKRVTPLPAGAVIVGA